MIVGPVHLSPTALPYARLNLRRNPFGELDLATRAELAVVEAEGWAEKLRGQRVAIQFIGQRGVGKTTHLLALSKLLPQAKYVYVREGEQPTLDAPLMLIDEAQRIARRRQRKLFAQLQAVAMATHVDLRPVLQSAGYLVETHDVERHHHAAKLQHMLNRRIEWARRENGPTPTIRLETAERLLREFGGRIREIEWRLYDVFQQLPTVIDV